jgi:hypothetical protein
MRTYRQNKGMKELKSVEKHKYREILEKLKLLYRAPRRSPAYNKSGDQPAYI